jgi:hypothetical protein
MDIDEFWKLIDITRQAADGDVSKQADLLVEILVKRPLDQILAYGAIMDDLIDNAYDAALWDAADIIGCGCSDDGFWEFRGWLIAHGKQVYENAINDPESLLNLIDVDKDAKDGYLHNVSWTAYEQKTGQSMLLNDKRDRPPRPELKGEHWPEEDRNARFPKLAAKFGDCEKRWRKWMTEDFPDKS